ALLDSGYNVSPAANYYFMAISTLLVATVGTLVTEKIIMPRFSANTAARETPQPISLDERRGLRGVGLFTLVFVALLLWGLVPDQGVLRGVAVDGGAGSLLDSPFINGIVTLIALYAAIAGWLFGRLSRRFTTGSDVVVAMESSMATMAGYLVLMFFAAQFVNYFAWSQLGIISAIKGAALLKALDPGVTLLLVSFVVFTALINLLIGSASAKWALLAPVFIPMLMLSGISPEATQVAYRVGDSTTNIITPLMPYFGVVVAFAQKYDRNIGIGTIIATMLPYSIALLLSWSLLLAAWIMLDLPLGPGAAIFVNG
ncbi:MAG: AbgT family transporter, partial [Porticoccaceae bacterium]